MSSLIQKAFNITKENIIIAQPLILFLLITTFTFSALMQQTNKIYYLVFSVANILLCTAFIAGWFYMIKQAIWHNKKVENDEYRNDDDKRAASNALSKEFFFGVGEYFLSITYTTLVYIVLYGLLVYLSFKAGLRLLPNPHINPHDFMTAVNSTPAEMQKYVYSLSFDQLKAMNIWMLFIGGIFSVFTFLTMFLFPAVYDKKETSLKMLFIPFIAFNKNLVFIFKHFAGSIGILLFLFLLNVIFSFLSLIFSINIVLSIIGLIFSFYFMTYVVVLIFLYYEENK